MDKGWISIHRKIFKNPILKPKGKYSRMEAWLYLLARATYSNQKVVLGSDIYHLKPGEILTSQLKLCERFLWGNSRLRTFLTLLEKDSSIKVKTNSKLTMITILNFSELQNIQIANKSQANDQRKHINKENKDKSDDEDNNMDALLNVLIIKGGIIWIALLIWGFIMCFKWIHETHKRRV